MLRQILPTVAKKNSVLRCLISFVSLEWKSFRNNSKYIYFFEEEIFRYRVNV